ncbi:MAG: ABC transporter substrate-binding protein [Sphaerochaetaceae bacterium]
MKRILTCMVLVLLVLVPSFAQPTVEQQDVVASVITFTDDLGRTVQLPSKIDRMLPSGTLAQYVLFPLCPDKMIGVGVNWSDSAKGIIADKYLNLPMVGQIYGSKASFNLEQVLKLDPQVVIDVGERKSGMSENLDKLQQQLGIPIIHIDATNATMDKAYARLGNLLGCPEEGKLLGDYCRTVLERTKAIVGSTPVQGIYVLGAKGVNVLAKGSYQSESVDILMDNLAVLENPSSKGTGNEVDMERILSWNPQYVIFSHDAQDVYAHAATDSLWSQVDAIKDGHFYLAPNTPQDWLGNPPSVNRFLGLVWAAKMLYPQAATYDLYEEIAKYFKLFYHATVSKDQIQAIIQK